jgi:cyclophilin family peptidyl-prolyl cis-trans isomerase
MRGRLALFIVLNFMLLSLPISASGQAEAPSWRSVGIDPSSWTDGPVEEATPMNQSYQGNAVFVIEIRYYTGLTSPEVQGNITIELFEQWAPITTTNIIQHIEMRLYDGVFFHRVVDNFVIQSGDPECKNVGGDESEIYFPGLPPQCGSGGTGETIPLEHDVNLSHVDGAMGMARGAEQDSADSQWYITDNEQHGLDPENRDDGGYAVFGIVRDGMNTVREIASTPTVTNPAPDNFANPGPDLLGRPIREVHIDSVRMIGVADPDGNIRFGELTEEAEPLITAKTLSISALILLGIMLLLIARIDPPQSLHDDTIVTFDAVLIDND